MEQIIIPINEYNRLNELRETVKSGGVLIDSWWLHTNMSSREHKILFYTEGDSVNLFEEKYKRLEREYFEYKRNSVHSKDLKRWKVMDFRRFKKTGNFPILWW